MLTSNPRIAPDLKHPGAEPRLIAIGRTPTGRPLSVSFTLRSATGQTLIRPLSARSMHAKEIESYEAQSP